MAGQIETEVRDSGYGFTATDIKLVKKLDGIPTAETLFGAVVGNRVVLNKKPLFNSIQNHRVQIWDSEAHYTGFDETTLEKIGGEEDTAVAIKVDDDAGQTASEVGFALILAEPSENFYGNR
jgi:hypothetical protein